MKRRGSIDESIVYTVEISRCGKNTPRRHVIYSSALFLLHISVTAVKLVSGWQTFLVTINQLGKKTMSTNIYIKKLNYRSN